MALSEEERRRLEVLEQELASSDPELVQKLQAAKPGKQPRAAAGTVHAVLALIAALALVIVGVATELIIVGVAGFLLMIAGADRLLKGVHFNDGPEPGHHA